MCGAVWTWGVFFSDVERWPLNVKRAGDGQSNDIDVLGGNLVKTCTLDLGRCYNKLQVFYIIVGKYQAQVIATFRKAPEASNF